MIGNWQKRNLFLVCVVVVWALGAGTTRGWAQQESPSKPLSVGAQAASVVLKHYALDPTALDPKTAQPLSTKGSWSLGKTPPATCPQTKETCVEVFYEVPAESVRCSWVVLLNAEGTDGKFLDEDDDTERYMLLTATKSEAKDLVDTRKKPVFPPIAVAMHASGSVVLNVLVDKTGEPQNYAVVTATPLFVGAAMDAAKAWKFKPMMIGARAVPYVIQLTFGLRSLNPNFTTVEVTP